MPFTKLTLFGHFSGTEGSCLLLLPHMWCPGPFLYPHLLFCPQQVTLIHSKIALADAELLHSVRQEVKEILLRKGVRLLLGMDLSPPKIYKLLLLQPSKGL